MIGVPSEIARLEEALAAEPPEIKKQTEKWEKAVAAGSVWAPLEIASTKSKAGATLTKEPDGSVLASGTNPANDVYTLTANTSIKDITAVRIEALPDPSLPGNGPGRSPNGNFVLSTFEVYAASKGDKDKGKAVDFDSADASFEQDKYPAYSALIDGKDIGWAILPNTGRPATATFIAADPFGSADSTRITIVLGHNFSAAQHTLGHFRLWITSSADPELAPTLPPMIHAILKTAADKRTKEQSAELTAYFRSISPSLEPVKYRLAELKAPTQAEQVFPARQEVLLAIPVKSRRI